MITDRPYWAAYVWFDRLNIYIQPPGCGYATSLPFTEGGLSKALAMIRSKSQINGDAVINQPTPTKIVRAMPEDKREKYRMAMKRLGML